MAQNPSPKKFTNKHIARQEKEKKQQQALIGGLIAVVVIIVGLLGYGLLNEYVIKPSQPVAVVGADKITPDNFQSQIRFNRYQLIQQYSSTRQIYEMFQSSPEFGEQFAQNLQQIEYQLSDVNAVALANDALNQQVDTLVVKQEAEKMGISISDAEVEELLQNAFNFYPNGTPTAAPTSTPFSTATLSPTQLALVTATPLPEEVEPEEPVVTPEAEEAEDAADEEAEPTVEPSPFPTATPYTLEGFEENFNNYIEQMSVFGITEEELREQFKNQLIYEKVLEEVTADVVTEETQVWARHILVPDKAVADLLLSELADGKDWGELAASYSEDESNKDRGGDLGWFGSGQMVPDFEAAAFALEIGEISEPVATDFGWHIIQLLGKEVRPLSTQAYQTNQSIAFSDWLTGVKEGREDIEIFDTWEEYVISEPNIPADMYVPIQ